MRMNNTIKFANWQASEIKNGFFSVMAGARLAFESARRHRAARIAGWVLIAALVLVLEWIIAARVEQGKAQALYTERVEQFKADYLDQQDAARRGMPIDPRVELRKQEATAFAKLMSGLKLYGYGTDDFRTLAQGVACRVANPGYPDTIVEVIEQPKQWPGYADTNEITQKDFDLAQKILAELDAQEHPPISSDYVYASFERDGIALRDTWEIGTRTKFWRAGE